MSKKKAPLNELSKKKALELEKKQNNSNSVLRTRCFCCCIVTLTDRASNIPSNNMDVNPVRGHKEVLRSTGHIMVTSRYSDQQRSKSRQKVCDFTMAPTNIKTVHQTSLLHIESSLDLLGLLSSTHDQRSQQRSGEITLQVSQGHTSYKNKEKRNPEVHGGGGGLELVVKMCPRWASFSNRPPKHKHTLTGFLTGAMLRRISH